MWHCFTATRNGQNGNEAVASAASETFTRWLPLMCHRYNPIELPSVGEHIILVHDALFVHDFKCFRMLSKDMYLLPDWHHCAICVRNSQFCSSNMTLIFAVYKHCNFSSWHVRNIVCYCHNAVATLSIVHITSTTARCGLLLQMSVCVSLCNCHDREPCKNGWTDQDAVWQTDLRSQNGD